MTPILIDGSVLEGGGQILRNSISLSSLLSKPVSIHKIRNGRKPPGLKNQHRTVDSTEIDFIPGTLRLPGQFTADSAAQTASHAPQIDYTQHVFLPFVRRHFGIDATLDIKRRGYYPKGGGEIHVQVSPMADKIRAFTLVERGSVKAIKGIAHLAGLPSHLGKGMVEGAKGYLAGSPELDGVPVEIESRRERNDNTGGGIVGGDALSRKGLDAQAVGRLAAESLLRGLSVGGCVDEWLQDQIIIFMALAEGTSEINCGKGELELHTQTAIWVAQQLTDAKFEVEVDLSGCTVIRCRGIGYSVQGNK
ncbi:RNA 3'-terminal phosphate cyclase/enolpyruvate transferase [Desarmillaria tabescens]|uniref:RNA 3'-terminal phosphate cyclase/enolpyruvate transferase n=1 Tax=Armillaria tabescens TaxID=1929756 RepID=A0AA39JTP8_ARMTA|nr:RNA 3'-terminal phosphate cyclase/enolpyruvate transferase [Desarmillaria tabescens]KAK0448362.1 RNA 3'-terminal phosphate cyclase/enolpyruvate transferase [Desarmillaria tabescens]